MVPNYTRPLDSADSIRSSHRVYRDPTSSQSPSFSITSITRPECSSFSRNCRSGEERSNSSPVTQPHRPGVLQQCICCPQERWGVETSNQPKETKCFHLHPSLQDGEYQSSQRSPPPRRLPRSQGCLFNSTYESSVLKVSLLCLERNSVRIQNSPIRSSNSTDNIYKITSPCSSIIVLSGNTSPHIPGRYTASCPDLRYGNPSLSIVTNLLESLGFTLNEKKCILSPSQNLEFLGFQIDTIIMSLSLPPDKVQKIRKECHHCLHMSRTTPRQLAHLIGLMTSTSPAVLPAPLHYRMLQILRSQALSNHQSYDIPFPGLGKPIKIWNGG